MTTRFRKHTGIVAATLENAMQKGVLLPDSEMEVISNANILECVSYHSDAWGFPDALERIARRDGSVEWYEVA